VDTTSTDANDIRGRPGFRALRDEAYNVLCRHQDGLSGTDLAAAVFGTGSGGRWAALLPSVLGDDDRVERVDRLWRVRLGGQRTSAMDLCGAGTETEPVLGLFDALAAVQTIVALALGTTGADPRRHRIARVSLVRFEAGQVVARFDEVVDSGGRLAGYLKVAGRVADEDLEHARSFGDLVPRLLEIINGDAAYVYGAARARAFIDAELRRADLPDFGPRFIEIDTLVKSLTPGLTKPGLRAAAAELGVVTPGSRSPLAEAELAARIVSRLRDRLGTSPARPILEGDRPASSSANLPFTQEWLAQIPDAPGTYQFRDANGITLYVGKAANLRRRLADYIRRQPSLHRRFEALGVRTATVETTATASDLEATLLEAYLIRAHQPGFNVARAVRGPATIVRAATDGPRAGVRLVERSAVDGARYFGPFESVSAARTALNLARVAYPAAFPRYGGDQESRRQAVIGVCQLLAGLRAPTVRLLQDRMREAAKASDRAEVDRLRAAVRGLQSFTPRMSDLAGRSDGARLLVLERCWEDGPGRLHLVQGGRLLASANTDASTLPNDMESLCAYVESQFYDEDADSTVNRPAAWTAEDAIVLQRWIAQTRPRLEIWRIPRTMSEETVD
jgi:DNA polymerase III epsilon subunit-like protein